MNDINATFPGPKFLFCDSFKHWDWKVDFDYGDLFQNIVLELDKEFMRSREGLINIVV